MFVCVVIHRTSQESLGLFRAATKKSSWPAVRKALRLLEEKEKVDLKAPNDFNFAYSGYAPLSVRLVELAAKPVRVLCVGFGVIRFLG